jgi:energy-coupling factor transporter ATP-binding protein EcfA2
MTVDLGVVSTNPETTANHRRAIASIRVEGLHGKFSYTLDVAPRSESAGAEPPSTLATVTEDRLTLLYGRNGTGKTSLLRLLFHALSPAPNRGHRSALRRMRFREFSVLFTDGSRVRYSRNGDDDIGGFVAEVTLGGDALPIKCEFWGEPKHTAHHFDPDQLTMTSPEPGAYITTEADWRRLALSTQMYLSGSDPEEEQFVHTLAGLRVNPIFLEDSRAITGDVLDRDDAKRARAAFRARAAREARERGTEPDEDTLPRREVDIDEALERVRLYLSQLAFTGTQAGSFRVDTVYVNVAEAIIEHSSKVGRPNKYLVPQLRAKVDALNERAARFHTYGLLPESPMLELADRLEGAENKHGPILTQVLTPHLDGFSQRMDALEPGLDAVASFVDALNAFLLGKQVRFSPGREGLSISDEETNERISPRDLSSGEKQIVLMFSDVIALQDDTKLFLIDEPELSLNPDWQRQLMPSLLGVTEASGMQLVAATHSIEIMARYRDRRRQLPG